MSKIFDALRKVQAEAGRKGARDRPPETGAAQEAPGHDLDVPEAFASEMVSMRYSVDSKVSRAHKSLVFTCSVPGEGVSAVSRLFCKILVQDPGSRVILVDANVHDPTVHEAFGVARGPGLMEILAGRNSVAECIQKTEFPRLEVIPIGEASMPPMQAFASGAMKKTVADLLASCEYLVFDAPPVLSYPEATILGSRVDGVLFVVQAIRTKKEVIKKAVEALTKAGGDVLGVILNRNKRFIPEFIYKRV